MSNKIISLINQKGGVGKTVTAVHLGASLALAGRKVLLIDVDLQHGLTSYFGLDTEGAPTTSDVLLSGCALGEAAQVVRDNLALVPATRAMEDAEVALAGAAGGEVRLRRAVRGLNGYDFVLIDCPSGWGAVTRNALLASNAMIVPINSEPAAVHTAIATDAGARELSEYHDHALSLLGVLLTRHRSTSPARAVAAQVQKQWGAKVFKTRIRQAEKINRMAIAGTVTGDGSASSDGAVATDYRNLATEVIARCRSKNKTN